VVSLKNRNDVEAWGERDWATNNAYRLCMGFGDLPLGGVGVVKKWANCVKFPPG
jgi:hypothetical protein